MNEFVIGVIGVVVVIFLYMALRIYLKLKAFRKNNEKIGVLADKLMEEYLADGLDKRYRTFSDENLMKEYKDLLAQNDESIEDKAMNGVKCKLLEDEMTFRGIKIQPIIDEILKKN